MLTTAYLDKHDIRSTLTIENVVDLMVVGRGVLQQYSKNIFKVYRPRRALSIRVMKFPVAESLDILWPEGALIVIVCTI